MHLSKSRLFIFSVLFFVLVGCAISLETQNRKPAQSTAQPSSVKATPNQELKFFLFTPQCFENILQGHYFDIECIKFTISKLLSYLIIVGSLLYKAPQIIKVLAAGSVEGLSLSSFYSQLLMVIITIGYNLHLKAPLSTYAENISVFVQTFILIVLHWRFNPKTSTACVIASLAFFGGTSAVLYLDLLPDFVYDFIGTINIVMFFFAVAPQIKLNYENKSTGQLALITQLLAFGGNLARVFTTLQEVKDSFLLAFFAFGSLLNGIVVLQFFLYRKAKPIKSKKTE